MTPLEVVGVILAGLGFSFLVAWVVGTYFRRGDL